MADFEGPACNQHIGLAFDGKTGIFRRSRQNSKQGSALMVGTRMMANRHQNKSGWSMKRRSPLRGLLQTRQIYVRSNSDVQFITVSPISQISLLIIVLIGFLWMAFASVNIVFKDQLLELKQQKLFEARLDYENRLSELRASVERVNDRLLLDQKSYLQKVDEVKAEFDNLAAQQKKMEDFFREGWFPLKPNAAPALPQNSRWKGRGNHFLSVMRLISGPASRWSNPLPR